MRSGHSFHLVTLWGSQRSLRRGVLLHPAPSGQCHPQPSDLGRLGDLRRALCSALAWVVRCTIRLPRRLTHLPVQEMWVGSLGGEDPLKKEIATHSSILAWRIPWTEEPGGLQSMESHRVTVVTQCSLHCKPPEDRDREHPASSLLEPPSAAPRRGRYSLFVWMCVLVHKE